MIYFLFSGSFIGFSLFLLYAFVPQNILSAFHPSPQYPTMELLQKSFDFLIDVLFYPSKKSTIIRFSSFVN